MNWGRHNSKSRLIANEGIEYKDTALQSFAVNAHLLAVESIGGILEKKG
jgi:hypothetical protein